MSRNKEALDRVADITIKLAEFKANAISKKTRAIVFDINLVNEIATTIDELKGYFKEPNFWLPSTIELFKLIFSEVYSLIVDIPDIKDL